MCCGEDWCLSIPGRKPEKIIFLIANASWIPEISPLLITAFYLAIVNYEKNAYKAIVCQSDRQ